MKNLHLFNLRRLSFIACLCGLFFMANCSGVISTLDQYSGETLYESAAESPDSMLDLVPEVQKDVNEHLETDEQRRIFNAFQQEFANQLIVENPDLVEEFAEKLKSGDQEQIHEVLNEAGDVVEQELQNLTGQSEITAKNVVESVLGKYDVD